ncbi:MAG TPA: hypothetical protein VGA04_10075, partial [Streptosporangiaceae bacterium]
MVTRFKRQDLHADVRPLREIGQVFELGFLYGGVTDRGEQRRLPHHSIKPDAGSIFKPALALTPDAEEVVELAGRDHGWVGQHDSACILGASARG